MPKKLTDTAREAIEQVAWARDAIPSDVEIAKTHNISRSLVAHVMKMARKRKLQVCSISNTAEQAHNPVEHSPPDMPA